MKTLFIVGAGASAEVGMPTGHQLRSTIARLLDIRFPDGYEQEGGDPRITQALRHLVRNGNHPEGINPYLHAGWHIRDAMPQAISIDNFIEQQNNDKITLCGKLAITCSILDAEKTTPIYFNNNDGRNMPDFAKLEDIWHNKFLQLLTQGCKKEQLSERIGQISFIIFNYDRCIEHFMYHAIKNFYRITEKETASFMKFLNVIHPYGAVGQLPWQSDGDGTPFGSTQGDKSLLLISNQIKTFTERVEDDDLMEKMRSIVTNAEMIVFLGFAFHPQNMDLINPRGKCATKKIFSTAFGISESDCDVVSDQIFNLVGGNEQRKLHLRRDLRCSGLFDEYWRSLAIQ